jgi:hypothetical protein
MRNIRILCTRARPRASCQRAPAPMHELAYPQVYYVLVPNRDNTNLFRINAYTTSAYWITWASIAFSSSPTGSNAERGPYKGISFVYLIVPIPRPGTSRPRP